MTIRVRPPRRAAATSVLPALLVEPFLTPIRPGYGSTPSAPVSSRLVFSISKDQPPPPGNMASTVEQYRANSALRSPARPNTARS